jgi:hypothetical protein
MTAFDRVVNRGLSGHRQKRFNVARSQFVLTTNNASHLMVNGPKIVAVPHPGNRSPSHDNPLYEYSIFIIFLS